MINWLAGPVATKVLAVALGLSIALLGASTLYFRGAYERSQARLADTRAELLALQQRLMDAEARAKLAEQRLSQEVASLVESHRAELARVRGDANARIARLRAELEAHLAELRQCRVDAAIVRVLNEPNQPTAGDGAAAPAAGTGGSAAPYAGAGAGDVTCADVVVWASQLREAKELNDQQLRDVQRFYNTVRERNNALFQ